MEFSCRLLALSWEGHYGRRPAGGRGKQGGGGEGGGENDHQLRIRAAGISKMVFFLEINAKSICMKTKI